MKERQWSGKTKCNSFWMNATLFGIRTLSLRGFYCLMSTFIPFYMIGCREATKVCYRYFRLRHGYSRMKAIWSVYVTMFRFGQMLTDRFAAVDGFKFKYTSVGKEDLWNSLEADSKGFVQLGSHAGNFELCGYMFTPKHKHITTLVYLGEGETVMNNRYRMFTPHNISMTAVSQDMSHIFELNQALADGDVVSMPGDRVFGSSKTVSVSSMGATAELPQGPFSLASARKCPIVAVFCMKTSWDSYDIRVIRMDDSDVYSLPRREQVQRLADNYSKALDSIINEYPTQWFNFYEFWK